MKNKIALTARDREILLAILHKVPVHSESVLALWWPDIDEQDTKALDAFTDTIDPAASASSTGGAQ